jgi:hypothetical protein
VKKECIMNREGSAVRVQREQKAKASAEKKPAPSRNGDRDTGRGKVPPLRGSKRPIGQIPGADAPGYSIPALRGSTTPETRGTKKPSSNGDARDGQGKFAKGNAGGPGNPFARQTAALRSAILRFMTPEKIEELVKVMFEQALQGDMRAAKLILSYSVGQPRPAVDPDRLDVDEVDLFGKQARTPEEFDRILYSPTARMMCMLLQTMVPGFEKESLEKLAAGIREMDERERTGRAGQAVRSQAEPRHEKETSMPGQSHRHGTQESLAPSPRPSPPVGRGSKVP